MKLTQRNTDALTLPEGKTDHIEWCDTMPGFGYRLRQGAGGQVLRTWICQYRFGGVSRRLMLGKATAVKADEARKLAQKAQGDVAHDRDPQSDKQDRRGKDKHTFKSTVVDYLAAKKPNVRARTYVELQRYLTDEKYFGPLHTKPLDRIRRADVAVRLDRISIETTSIVARRARAQLSALFAWAVKRSRCDANPVTGTEQPQGGKDRDRVLSDIELAKIWRACGDDDYGRVIKLLILTGARRSEVGGMRWSEIKDGVWTLPATRSKNGRAHSLVVLPMMQAVLDTIPKMASHDTLFGVRGGGFTSWSEGKTALDARVSLNEPWTVHDLRRTAASRMGDLDVLPHVVETILNHASGHKRGVAGTYNRSKYANQTRAALLLWHDHVRTLIDGGERKVIFMQQDAS